MNLVEKVKAVIEREGLIPPGSQVAVGVSGGADSVALLHILHRLGFPVSAVHLNHSLRGAEADGDEAFVRDLCGRLGIDCVMQKADVAALAAAEGISIEMAARRARHDFFGSIVQSPQPQALIALAHHADDQLETFFLRAARGSGIDGLGGMRFRQAMGGLVLIRPLLEVRRNEIIDWLCAEEIEWREDVSNLDETIPRNFVRHELLPKLGQLNSKASENILRTMQVLRDEADAPEKAARRREIRDWLIEQGVSPDFQTVEEVIKFSEKKNGTSFLDLEGVRLVNEYGVLKVGRASSLSMHVTMQEGIGILRGPWKASVSLKKVAGREVIVRTPRPGDRMHPYGMDGSRKLQDIFTDLKIPRAQRECWPVVECAGEIIWLPGYRIARGWELAGDAEPALQLRAE